MVEIFSFPSKSKFKKLTLKASKELLKAVYTDDRMIFCLCMKQACWKEGQRKATACWQDPDPQA